VVAVSLAGLAARAAPRWDAALFNQGYYREIYTEGKMDLRRLTNQKLLFYREGHSPVAIFNVGGEASLRVTGKTDASTNAMTSSRNCSSDICPSCSQDPRRVAVVGYGSGISAMAMLTHPFVEALDVIELERSVIDACVAVLRAHQ
jgi:spermidine synthase